MLTLESFKAVGRPAKERESFIEVLKRGQLPPWHLPYEGSPVEPEEQRFNLLLDVLFLDAYFRVGRGEGERGAQRTVEMFAAINNPLLRHIAGSEKTFTSAVEGLLDGINKAMLAKLTPAGADEN